MVHFLFLSISIISFFKIRIFFFFISISIFFIWCTLRELGVSYRFFKFRSSDVVHLNTFFSSSSLFFHPRNNISINTLSKLKTIFSSDVTINPDFSFLFFRNKQKSTSENDVTSYKKKLSRIDNKLHKNKHGDNNKQHLITTDLKVKDSKKIKISKRRVLFSAFFLRKYFKYLPNHIVSCVKQHNMSFLPLTFTWLPIVELESFFSAHFLVFESIRYYSFYNVFTSIFYWRVISAFNRSYFNSVKYKYLLSSAKSLFKFIKLKCSFHNQIIRNSYRRILFLLRKKISSFFYVLFRNYPTKRRINRRIATTVFFTLFKKILLNKRSNSFSYIRNFIFYFFRSKNHRFRRRWSLLHRRSRNYAAKRKNAAKIKNSARRTKLILGHSRRFSSFKSHQFITKPYSILRQCNVNFDKVRQFFFLFRYMNLSVFDFFLLCLRVLKFNGLLYDLYKLFEMSIFSFLSTNFFALSNHPNIFINNKLFTFDNKSKLNPISIGDIIEFRYSSKLHFLKSIYVESYILFFNIFLFCKLRFLQNMFYKELIFFVCPLLFSWYKIHLSDYYVFYPKWFFRNSFYKSFYRPLHYYFSSLLYKSYMPWLSFSMFNFPNCNKSFLSFINKLELTHKCNITNIFSYLSFNVQFLFSRNFKLPFFLISNLYYYQFIPFSLHNVVSHYKSEQFVRSAIAINVFQQHTYNLPLSNKYIINFVSYHGNKVLKIEQNYYSNLSRSFFSKDTKRLYFSSHNRRYKRRKSDSLLFAFIRNDTFLPNVYKNIKSLPSYLYSFYRRIYSIQSYGPLFIDINFSRKFFILHSSFAIMCKEFFDSPINTTSDNHIYSILSYNSFYSSLIKRLFIIPRGKFYIHKIIGYLSKYKYKFCSFDKFVSFNKNKYEFVRLYTGLKRKPHLRHYKRYRLRRTKMYSRLITSKPKITFFFSNRKKIVKKVKVDRTRKHKFISKLKYKHKHKLKHRFRKYKKKRRFRFKSTRRIKSYLSYIKRVKRRAKAQLRFVKRFIWTSFFGSYRYLIIRKRSPYIIRYIPYRVRRFFKIRKKKTRYKWRRIRRSLLRKRWRSSLNFKSNFVICSFFDNSRSNLMYDYISNSLFKYRVDTLPSLSSFSMQINRFRFFIFRSFLSKYLFESNILISKRNSIIFCYIIHSYYILYNVQFISFFFTYFVISSKYVYSLNYYFSIDILYNKYIII